MLRIVVRERERIIIIIHHNFDKNIDLIWDKRVMVKAVRMYVCHSNVTVADARHRTN